MKYGILGAGQLAQMLVHAANHLKLSVHVLARAENDPAATASGKFSLGDWKDPVSLAKFLGDCDRFVFENEFVPESSIRSLELELHDPRFYPRLGAMMRIQDKLEQKKIFTDLGLPSAPFRVEETWTAEKLKLASTDFPGGFVLKWSRLGYDGKGTWISPLEMNPRAIESALDFTRLAEAIGVPVYVEEKANFIRELAVVGCLSTEGEWIAYPVVVSEQRDGICHQTFGPAARVGVSAVLCEEIENAAERIARDSELYGTMALEVFQITESKFWINEVAPRVHNSGHFSLDGGMTSQFENHWRGIEGLPLGKTLPHDLFFMRNILGEDLPTSEAEAQAAAAAAGIDKRVRTHWYEKLEIRPGRKMGHINFWDLSPHQLETIRKFYDEKSR